MQAAKMGFLQSSWWDTSWQGAQIRKALRQATYTPIQNIAATLIETSQLHVSIMPQERLAQGGSREGAIGAIAPPKTYESMFIHHNLLQFGKQHSRYKPILSSIVLWQQWCEVYFISLTVANP